jgi:hypothetical protein
MRIHNVALVILSWPRQQPEDSRMRDLPRVQRGLFEVFVRGLFLRVSVTA